MTGAAAEGGTSPHVLYEARRAERAGSADALAHTDRAYSRARLAVFAVAVALAGLAFLAHIISALWLAPPVLVFVGLLVAHERVIRRRERADRAVRFYQHGLDRLAHRFAGQGEPGERHRDPHHAYADDLDLFGAGGLYERLCTARTTGGEDLLARWLLAPADPGEVAERQAAVRELEGGLDLREDLALLGEDVRAGLHPLRLRAWGEAPPVLTGGALTAVAVALPALTLGAAWLGFRTAAGPFPFLIALALQMAFAFGVRERVARAADAADASASDLALFASLLERLERERPSAPRLAALRAALDTDGTPPSRGIARLRLLAELLEARRNQLFAPIAGLLLWKTNLALALERWRARFGPSVGHWIDAVAELEALSALAGFAYEQPETCWPEVVDGDAAHLEAEQLGHPLLPPDRCVRNDVRLGTEPQVWVVSGSNMSGKSTLMRTLGVNTVLALAGAPAYARRMRLSRLQIGASIRIQDSLQEGTSRFYAEIKRLRQVMELAEGRPRVLFLLDEILHGTNSHDRGIGAEAVVRGLLARGAIGLVTTHDLALARVADELGPVARNVHFEDRVEDGRMEFDYVLRPGVVTHSNALALMRAVGLEV